MHNVKSNNKNLLFIVILIPIRNRNMLNSYLNNIMSNMPVYRKSANMSYKSSSIILSIEIMQIKHFHLMFSQSNNFSNTLVVKIDCSAPRHCSSHFFLFLVLPFVFFLLSLYCSICFFPLFLFPQVCFEM